MLFDQNLKLSFEFGLFRIVWFALAVSWQAGHVLDNKKTKLVTSLVEQMRFIFYLLSSVNKSFHQLCQQHLHAFEPC